MRQQAARAGHASQLETPPIAVVANSEAYVGQARELAQRLNLPLIHPSLAVESAFSLALVCGEKGLSVVSTCTEPGGEVRVDFIRGPTGYRRVASGSRRQPLASAVGLRRGCRAVFDATAGLGRDAFQLACLGCRVTAVERSPIVAALLRDGLRRALLAGDEKLRAVIERIAFSEGDSRELLRGLTEDERPDVVYIDTMYGGGGRSALSKKEMRVCRMLVGEDRDAGELLRTALTVARRRVVVKRHREAEPLRPDVSVRHRGRSVRYDVYLVRP